MKKFLSLMLAITLTCCFMVSCANNSYNPQPNYEANEPEAEMQKPEPAETKEPEPIKVSNIFLSKSNVELGVGESISLIATVSPSNAEYELTWTSSDENIASVENGLVTAKSEGTAVIKVESDNGILSVCSVDVHIKTGKVSGKITYKYNNYVGNRGDTGATIMLISKDTESLDDGVALGFTSYLPDGCFGTKADGDGNYSFDGVPVGDYYVVVISRNTNKKSSTASEYDWGYGVCLMFSENGRENALLSARVNKIDWSSISVKDGQTTTFSHDFGITYI